jgi:hypothetical protein
LATLFHSPSSPIFTQENLAVFLLQHYTLFAFFFKFSTMSNVPLHWLQKTPPRPPRDAGPAQRDDSDEETAQNREFNPPASSSPALKLNLCKRPAPEDLGQYADSLSRKLRLKLQAHEELRLFSQVCLMFSL